MSTVPAVGEIFARVFNPHKAEYEFEQWLSRKDAGRRFLNGKHGAEILNLVDYQPGQVRPMSPELGIVRQGFGYEYHRVQCWVEGIAMVADPRGVLAPAYSLPGFTEVVTVDEPRFRLAPAA